MNSRPSSSSQSQAFGRLARPVQRWVWMKEWESFREIQERAIATLLDDDCDVVISAATAGGKTEAAFLPLISSVLEDPGRGGFDLVYLSPLKALINDQFGRLSELCAKTELPVYPWHGDISLGLKSRARRKPRGVLLITPESLEALFVLRGLEIPRLFECTRAIVIDELHAFLDNERGIQVRSLLTRMELAVGRRIRRVGLSATLGEMDLTRQYLRPEAPGQVVVLESKSTGQELKVQIRGYLETGDTQSDSANGMAARRTVADHLFNHLRGSRNLIFAGSRQNVEWYADALRMRSEQARLPLEFFPHHASLSREHRTDLEKRLRTHPATTAVCTSTLELGIDIGEIECVAQIGPPFSVASLRQRLGRSGRRAGRAAVLRMYQIETAPSSDSHPLDRMHLGLIRSIAMVELLIQRWCEPPSPRALHLSTLTHQVLSVIAERGGVRATDLYTTLCKHGPFQTVEPILFVRLLKRLGSPDVELIEQAPEGILLLGRAGERLVNHHSFYAVFETPQEFRILANGKVIGVLPVTTVLVPGMTIVFSGRRWQVTGIHDRDKVIDVVPDRVGQPPHFGGGGGVIHDRVIKKMCEVLSESYIPAYLDSDAACLLRDARSEYERLDLDRRSIREIGPRHSLIVTGVGTVKTTTLALGLRSNGYRVMTYDGFLDVRRHKQLPRLEEALVGIANSGTIHPETIRAGEANLITEKFHRYLSDDLLLHDAVTSRLDLEALPGLARAVLTKHG